MMSYKSKLFAGLLGLALIVILLQISVSAQNVKRVVVFKVDGLSADYLDQFVRQKDIKTGKSRLPWFEHIFYKNGTRLSNFYTRGISLSASAWSTLDTGQHLQIKGNVEFDRFTMQSSSYLNVLIFQLKYGVKKAIDMPGVEILDKVKNPLLSDIFPFEKRYTSYQLLQRGNGWGVLGLGFLKMFPTDPNDLIDEWGIGLDYRNVTNTQSVADIVKKVGSELNIDYFDYFTGDFDHISHVNNSRQARFNALKELDQTLGAMWTAIQKSPRADETALIVISDHGVNSDEQIFSQGFNLVKLLDSESGGGHHIGLKQRLMRDYSIKGFYPLEPFVISDSKNSLYLKGEEKIYPTALLDFDGNERASLHLRNNDLNILHILLKQLKSNTLSPITARAATDAFFDVLKRRREGWLKTLKELNEELDALNRWIETQKVVIDAQPKKFTSAEIATGINEEATRISVQSDLAITDEAKYREYIRTLANLLSLNRDNFNPQNMLIEDYIAKGAMEERNSIYNLQNYVIGLSEVGLTVDANEELDLEKSFKRVNYFALFENQTVRNNVQKGIGNRPIDFVATQIPLNSITSFLSPELKPDEDPIWIDGGAEKQALILTRLDKDGNQSFRYLPVANLKQDSAGRFSFEIKEWDKDFPLKMFEDENLNVSGRNKTSWLNQWHTDREWLEATHKTAYSNGIIGLNEQLDDHELRGFENISQPPSDDEKLIHRFRVRQRYMTNADLLLLASNHWNFDVRGFNPGGNHGSFFRVSTNSTFMAAGGVKTKIPRGLNIETPYDSLSFMPTVLSMMGKLKANNEPNSDLYKQGFRKFPGLIVHELADLP